MISEYFVNTMFTIVLRKDRFTLRSKTPLFKDVMQSPHFMNIFSHLILSLYDNYSRSTGVNKVHLGQMNMGQTDTPKWYFLENQDWCSTYTFCRKSTDFGVITAVTTDKSKLVFSFCVLAIEELKFQLSVILIWKAISLYFVSEPGFVMACWSESGGAVNINCYI